MFHRAYCPPALETNRIRLRVSCWRLHGAGAGRPPPALAYRPPQQPPGLLDKGHVAAAERRAADLKAIENSSPFRPPPSNRFSVALSFASATCVRRNRAVPHPYFLGLPIAICRCLLIEAASVLCALGHFFVPATIGVQAARSP